MRTLMRCAAFYPLLMLSLLPAVPCLAMGQAAASGMVTGTVTDPTGAVLPGATVKIQNPVSQYERTATTDNAGHFQIPNVAGQLVPHDREHDGIQHVRSTTWRCARRCR